MFPRINSAWKELRVNLVFPLSPTRATMKAVDAAISSRQWNKAIQILEVVQDPSAAGQYYRKIAQHYAIVGEYEVGNWWFGAKLCYLQCIKRYHSLLFSHWNGSL